MPRDPLPSETPIANPTQQPLPGPVLAGEGCQFIAAAMSVAELAGDDGKCGWPVVWRSPYCSRHHRRCVRPPLPYEYLLRLAGLPEAGSPEAGAPEDRA